MWLLKQESKSPMVNDKSILFPKEYSIELLQIANGDLKSAEVLFKSMQSGRLENILYMAQQSVEKSIKAMLIHFQIKFPLVHDIGILVALLPADQYPPGGFELTSLNPYASVRRYEEGRIPLEFDEIQAALKAAHLVVAWAGRTIKV